MKDTRKKANKEAMLEQRAKEEALKKEALDFYRQLREHGLKPFDGASIDFHRERNPVVFIPRENPVITAVRKEELLNFLRVNDIRRVLVDALFPSRVPLLQLLLEHDIEVYVLRRPTALSGFKAMLERRYNEQKQDGNNNNCIKIPRKNDFVDAVALAFTWPKFHRKLDTHYIMCWRPMNEWRRVYTIYYKIQQMIEDLDENEIPVTLHEDRVAKNAREFVDTVEMHYPEVRRVFEKIRIPDDDVIVQALCCEVVLEVYHIPKKSDVLEKAGIRYSPTPKKTRPKKKAFVHDGKLLLALTQLAIRLYRLNPRRQKRKVMWKATKLAERIWKCSRMLQ